MAAESIRRCVGPCATYKELTEENFFRDKDGLDGWSRKCKECDREYQRTRRRAIKLGTRVVKSRKDKADA